MENRNNVTEFILLGLTQNPKMEPTKSYWFLVIFIVSEVGNVLTMVTITTSPLLGSPMYFFLAHLSFIDVCYSCVNTPKLILGSLHEKKTSSFNGCMIQIFGEHLFGGAYVILLTAMAYDHYVAICKPLHYTSIINWQVCWFLVGVAWAGGILHATIQILFTFSLLFCGPNVIDHFMCDLNPFLELACTDTHTLGLFVATNSGFISLLIFLLLVGSYRVILLSLRAYVPSIFVQMIPVDSFPIDKGVFYMVIAPMLNPLIYTLINDQMKNAIRKIFTRKVKLSDKLNALGAQCSFN
ncbi:hypothetical protein K5549_015387 [Capra hircus]|nr:hypothetical protein K5549_015387 [Capra hircus]